MAEDDGSGVAPVEVGHEDAKGGTLGGGAVVYGWIAGTGEVNASCPADVYGDGVVALDAVGDFVLRPCGYNVTVGLNAVVLARGTPAVTPFCFPAGVEINDVTSFLVEAA